MRELEELLVNKAENVPLDAAVLQLASVEYADLDIGYFVEVLDSHARELGELTRPSMCGEEFIETANEYLYENLGFRGNRTDYYNPRNSCLNDVLVERQGIPITLTVVYMEIARRLGREVRGVGMPGHFLGLYRDREFTGFIDCFNGGRILEPEECRQLAWETARVDIAGQEQFLEPVKKWKIVLRMLDNLRVIYFRRKDFEKAVRVLDLYLAALPGSAEEYKQRGLLHLHQQRPADALADLQRYLKLSPHAADKAEVEEQADNIRRLLRSLN